MDPSAMPGPSPRRELQGPRPTPLKVRKDSYKIKKPPPAPAAPSQTAPTSAAPPPQPPPHHRPPVIIYTVSPKIIHTNPSDFMTLVQRLTGPDSSAGPSTDASLPSPSYAGGALSPAARLATIAKSAHSPDGDRARSSRLAAMDPFPFDMDLDGPVVDQAGSFPGILSPMPASLPPISPSFFSPITSFDTSSLSFLQELSPIFSGNRSFMDGGATTILPSPNNFLSTPTVPSPGSCWEVVSQFPDF